MRPGESPNDDAKRHDRQLKAVELRRRGKSYRTIADELGVSVRTAFDDVWKHFSELDKLATEELEQVRKLEVARLDRYLDALEPACEEGDAKAIATAIKVGERRAKLLGLDAPAKVEHTTPDDYDRMTPADRIKAHRDAIDEEQAKLDEKEARH